MLLCIPFFILIFIAQKSKPECQNSTNSINDIFRGLQPNQAQTIQNLKGSEKEGKEGKKEKGRRRPEQKERGEKQVDINSIINQLFSTENKDNIRSILR